MKKIILASILTAVGVMAQSTGSNAPAAPKANPAPAATAPATPAPKTTVKRHHKAKKDVNATTPSGTTQAVKPAAGTTKDAPKTPAAK
jgi:hypothetical protein